MEARGEMISAKILEEIDEAWRRGTLSREARAHLQRWAQGEEYADHHEEISRLVGSRAWEELNDAFGEVIPFGTGGRRGPMGVGPNRINDRTIGESAQGLASSLLRSSPRRPPSDPLSVVIAFDTRNGSRHFAQKTASVLAGNGVRALLFDSPRSTPELSFAVRRLRAAAGVVISASHNPPTDNGFKAYWSDGGQVVYPHDRDIIEEVMRVGTLRAMAEAEARSAGLWRDIGEEVDRAYISYVSGLCLNEARRISAVFTPLHGTGTRSVWPVLQEAGFRKLFQVERQWAPDGDFPGVPGKIANPEVPAALQVAQSAADEMGADLVLASDPDADRLGASVRSGSDWVFLNGNQIGSLLVDHVVDHLARKGTLQAGGVVYKTLVTTDLVDRICAGRGIEVRGNLLVGFKYIAESIRNLPDPGLFVFGTEESHGYLRGPEVRDKDAAQAAVLLCERAAMARARGRSLIDDLEDLYRRHGYFREITHGVTFSSGAGRGLEVMRGLMASLRSDLPKRLGEERVVRVIDRSEGAVRDPESGKVTGEVEGTRGDVLVFDLSGDGTDRVSIRPSGTEPKIKVYVQVHGKPYSTDLRQRVDARAQALAAAMESLARQRTGEL